MSNTIFIANLNWSTEEYKKYFIKWEKSNNPYLKEIVKWGDKSWSEDVVWTNCQDVELECGHKKVYKHTGYISYTLICEKCKEIDEQIDQLLPLI